MEYIKKILESILTSLYQEFNAALVCAVLFMFVYVCIKENGFKKTCRFWYHRFRESKEFRRVFYLAFYSFMILFRTLLCRAFFSNPLQNIMGVWGLEHNNAPYTEGIENFILFVPFTCLLFWAFRNKIFKDGKIRFLSLIVKSIVISFLVSLGIETTQLLFKLGTFQLADLCFNTCGGMLGGIIYYLLSILKNKRKR